ncbi:MAG: radical SAM protein, partial [Fibrobacter sp.]|nr:radical SAM protein [Fibrobacter sp.]
MSTVIYPSPIFGPIHSRRLGVSLGINLLPADGKVCSFDCIYCECGYNADHRGGQMPDADTVMRQLKEKLIDMTAKGEGLDVITFAG